MNRISMMTWGLLLILVGIQLNLVESFVLTPRATQFWNNRANRGGQVETVPGNYRVTSNGYFQSTNAERYPASANRNSYQQRDYTYSTPSYQRNTTSRVPTYQSSYGTPSIARNATRVGPQKMVTAPPWFCWPPIFLGSVLFLFGAASRE